MSLKVIQWSTGNVGHHALRHPNRPSGCPTGAQNANRGLTGTIAPVRHAQPRTAASKPAVRIRSPRGETDAW